jgi:hypothetical protein
MVNNQSDINSFQIYKLFFDDIEEIFLNTISFRIVNILTLITCLFLIGILILLFYRSPIILVNCLIPFLYSLIFYDFIQLLSLILLKYNFTERFFNQLCHWPYYLKSSAEAGQCLTIIFLFALCRHQIRYFLTHHHLPNSGRIHSRALTFVCLLFIVYVNNWITHLKVEKLHLITLNETKYEINIQEVPISLYDMTEIQTNSHQRFIIDLDKYTQGYEKNILIQNQHTSSTDKIIHNHKDGSVHEIIIKFPYDFLFNAKSNRTKRKSKKSKRQQMLNKAVDENKNNNSYRINRCTYGQTNFFLSNFLSLIHSISYFILMAYYLTTIKTYKIANMTVNDHQQLYEKSVSLGRKKSAERHKQVVLLIHLKQFLYLIIYSHALFAFIRLIYICLLTLILCLVQAPFKWFSIKIIFYSLFLIGYFSIPLRMGLLFLYLFFNHFSTHIQSLIYYIFHTKLQFSWKLERPTICFRLQFIPYIFNSAQDENLNNSLVIDVSSSIDEDHSNVLAHDSVVVYDENSSSHNGITTNILLAPIVVANEPISNVSVIARL